MLLVVISGRGVIRLGQARSDLNYLSTAGVGPVDGIGKLQTAFGVVRSDIADAAFTAVAAGTTTSLDQLDTDETELTGTRTQYLGTDRPAPRPTGRLQQRAGHPPHGARR